MTVKNLLIIVSLFSTHCFAQENKPREIIKKNTVIYIGINNKLPYDTNFFKISKIDLGNNFTAKVKKGIVEISPKSLGLLYVYIHTNKGIRKTQLQVKRLSSSASL